ncbi:Ankyrin repeat domain containing protein [Pandoravirus salinus]|uniref:Ankyrin repeat domain containing protein n=1 Tax=Pandoravirus salinus TaxID=1349410 RepID=S4W0U2_9VIRU|nr:ankyrin repeat domain [Pandoravirus salinus]AGO85416.1 Ankyrin repeat domain containing protein [Pandoravirus salinus]
MGEATADDARAPDGRARTYAACAINSLPDELMVDIFGRVDCVWLRDSVALVCRWWRRVVSAYMPRDCRGHALTMTKAWATLKAAHRGHVDCLDDLERRGLLCWSESVVHLAAANGRVAVLERAHAAHYPWDATACQGAARHGHLSVLLWLRHRGCPWDERTTYAAALGGHTDCLRWALKHGCPLTARAVEGAAATGHLAILTWLGEQWHSVCPTIPEASSHHPVGTFWTACATAAAARGGHLACLAYLHQSGCLWDARTTTAAATWGHLDCLVYAHEHECPWSVQATENAFDMGHHDCLVYAVECGCPVSARLASVITRLGAVEPPSEPLPLPAAP